MDIKFCFCFKRSVRKRTSLLLLCGFPALCSKEGLSGALDGAGATWGTCLPLLSPRTPQHSFSPFSPQTAPMTAAPEGLEDAAVEPAHWQPSCLPCTLQFMQKFHPPIPRTSEWQPPHFVAAETLATRSEATRPRFHAGWVRLAVGTLLPGGPRRRPGGSPVAHRGPRTVRTES